MAVQYVVLLRWDEIMKYATEVEVAWPFGASKQAEFELFNQTATAVGVSLIREWGCDLDCYYELLFPGP